LSVTRRTWAWPAIIAIAIGVGLFAWNRYSLRDLPLSGPDRVYLTLAGDPSRAMVVNYQTSAGAGGSFVRYDVASRDGNPETYTFEAAGVSTPHPFREDSRLVHHVTVQDLEPGAPVYYIVGDPNSGWSGERKFRTIPAEGPLRFVEGGDMRMSPRTRRMMARAAAEDPMFAVLGGDLAHGNGRSDRVFRWDRWFEGWQETMVTPEGFDIPMLAILGNHEVNDSTSPDLTERAPYYMAFFGHQSDNVHYVRTFGKRAAFFMLDSGHLFKHADQAAWLADALAEHADIPRKFAVYHKPVYPGAKDFQGEGATMGQKYWAPLFDQYDLTVAFEHHGHIFKRTQPLRNGEPATQGTLYMGDGCFGEAPRSIPSEQKDYLARLESAVFFRRVDITDEAMRVCAINEDGGIFDEYLLHDRTTLARRGE